MSFAVKISHFRAQTMLKILAFVIVYLVIVRWVLPRLGVPT
jgi:hypothetical protein